MVIRRVQRRDKGFFPELAGIEFTKVTKKEVIGKIKLRPELMAPIGFLHAGLSHIG